ncbi:MAG TPA: hypothetical protein VH684_27530 [Xanthobacteraceae bacterium]|jgi:hypothetical protein
MAERLHQDPGEIHMRNRRSIGTLALFALCAACFGAQAFDESKYPNFKGQWNRVGAPRWLARGEKAPLTREYQAYYRAILADQEAGGTGNWPSTFCIPQGMPAMMNLFDPMEIVVTADTTYILISHINDSYRRIYTDGRDWPAPGEADATYAGYSIGKWADEDGDGNYDALEIETRYLKGPRAFESTGLPLHKDNQSIITERIYIDKSDRDTLWDDITVHDHALSRPWTLHKKAVRTKAARPVWYSEVCEENNSVLRVGNQAYYLSADGLLMPSKKDQPPPNLKYFNSRK